MRKNLICLLILLVTITALPSYCFAKNHSKAFDSYATNGIKGTLTKEINILILNQLDANSNEKYINVFRNKDGSIDYIAVDTIKVNRFSNNISQLIYDSIKDYENKFKIPFGNTLGIKLLSGIGPKITFNVSHLNAVSYEVKSELISSGINQTLHRVSIVFNTEIECVAPFYDKKITITNEIIVSEILLMGNIPEIIVSPIGN